MAFRKKFSTTGYEVFYGTGNEAFFEIVPRHFFDVPIFDVIFDVPVFDVPVFSMVPFRCSRFFFDVLVFDIPVFSPFNDASANVKLKFLYFII